LGAELVGSICACADKAAAAANTASNRIFMEPPELGRV
jgi:hypothetical protein